LSAKPREVANVGAGLWKATGMWAWLFFRISGLILVFYLGAHIIIISTAAWTDGGTTFTDVMKFLEHPVALVLDLALVVAVLYHALNGVRIILMDFGIGIQRHKIIFWSCVAVIVVCFVIFAYVAFSYIANGENPWALTGVMS
jgi:succinate dehydrogenase / fumarate reductase, cytochrome b subunit